jgi:hypothetical protein
VKLGNVWVMLGTGEWRGGSGGMGERLGEGERGTEYREKQGGLYA